MLQAPAQLDAGQQTPGQQAESSLFAAAGSIEPSAQMCSTQLK